MVSSPPQSFPQLDIPSQLATWQWGKTDVDHPHEGISHWRTVDAADGTIAHLLEFAFAKNPRLRFALYDQDEDDDHPGDDAVDTWSRGIGVVSDHLSKSSDKKLIAVWNGLFFATDNHVPNPHGISRHIAPVVLQGKVRYNVGNHRWAFGVQYSKRRPLFKVVHLPDKPTLEHEFTYAACGAQCLIRDGKPLELQPFPRSTSEILKSSPDNNPLQAGHIPIVDHMKTSRTSVAWSKDSLTLYLLIVKEPDSETESALALRHGQPGKGGWTLADLQRFWTSKKVWGAVNLDGGDITQAAWRQRDGSYRAVPAGAATRVQELDLKLGQPETTKFGSIMYFYISTEG